MTKFGKLITAFAIILVIGAGAMYFLKKNAAPQQPDFPDVKFIDSFKTATLSSDSASYPNSYENIDYGFVFYYPADFDVKEIEEDPGFTVLAEGGGNKAFQIYINSFDEPGPLTPERIKKDIPGMNIVQSQTFSLAGTSALAFQTDTTIEAWFVHDGNLYQVTAPKDFTDELSKILATWKFE